MGLFSKGLLGLLFNESNNNRSGGYSSPEYRSATMWECRYCGKKYGSFQRPSANKYGTCPNSPYGKHYWEEV